MEIDNQLFKGEREVQSIIFPRKDRIGIRNAVPKSLRTLGTALDTARRSSQNDRYPPKRTFSGFKFRNCRSLIAAAAVLSRAERFQ
jgi:hypothetical protein